MVGLRPTDTARLLNVSSNTLRSWERHGLPVERTAGNHRRFDRHTILGLRDALEEGLQGASAVERALELAESGRYREPRGLRDRMERLEKRSEEMVQALEILAREIRDR